jgi:hypothetical protein
VAAKEHEAQKAARIREIELRELDARLAKIMSSPDFPRQVSPDEDIRRSFSIQEAKFLSAQMIAKSKRIEYAQTFKGDPDGLAAANEFLEYWLDRQRT